MVEENFQGICLTKQIPAFPQGDSLRGNLLNASGEARSLFDLFGLINNLLISII